MPTIPSRESFNRFAANYARRNGISDPENYRRTIEYAHHSSHSLYGPYPEDSHRSASEYERNARRAREA